MESDDEEIKNIISDRDRNLAARELKERLSSIKSCYNLLRKHGLSLQHTLIEFQVSRHHDAENLEKYMHLLNERATLFGIASHAMMTSCHSYLQSAEADGHKVFEMLKHERERTRELEKMVKDIAKQHTHLERKSRGATLIARSVTSITSTITNDEDSNQNEDYEREDVVEPQEVDLPRTDSLHVIRKSIWMQRKKSIRAQTLQRQSIVMPTVTVLASTKQRRTRVPDRPNITLNAWSILKNCVGKDLTKIPMPVHFNEPISMLQRMTEEMEYAELLTAAANITDKYEQCAYVATFSASAYSTTPNRTGKPFNPLLGETYECDRTEDLGWRSIAEQVSHHPPISAFYCEGPGWTCWQESTIKMKFKGKNLQIVTEGASYCKFHNTGNTYSWGKALTIINNIIIGKLWIDQQGDVEIKGLNSASGATCVLTYVPYSMFSRDVQRRVKGVVTNEANESKYMVQGYWDSKIEIAPIVSESGAEQVTGTFTTIWNRRMPDPESEKYHNFTKFTCELNEMEEGIAPTDTRLRPDVRLLEQGLWEESNVEKLRLEQKQRSRRQKSIDSEKLAKRSTEALELHEPIWFDRILENGKVRHEYNGKYWEAKQKQDWSRCPDIF